MLALFRNNQVTTAILLAIYVAGLHLPAMLGLVAMPAQMTGEGGLLFRNLFGWATGNATISAISAAIFIFIQALLVNSLADTFRLMNDRNWIPGALYALVASCLPDFLFLSAPLVAVTFVPIALRRIFRVYKQSQAYSTAFDAAFWVSVASLYHPAAVWLLPTAFLGIMNLRSFQAREQVAFFIGIFVPVFLAFTAYLWFDQGGFFLETQFSRWIGFPDSFLGANLLTNLKTALMAILLLTVLSGFNIYYYKKLIQVQKFITIFYWFLFAAILSAVLQPDLHPEFFILLMPSIAVFLSYSLQSLRNTFMAEVFHLSLLLAVFFIQFYSTQQHI